MTSVSRHRRTLLKFASTLPFLPAVAFGVRARITDVRLRSVRLEREVGTYPDWVGGTRRTNVGGGAILEIHTDQGVTGIGPELGEDLLPRVRSILVGQDPFDVNRLAAELLDRSSFSYRGPASADIALWDLIGKLADQPLYKLWGGGRDRVPPYSSMLSLGTPRERAETALQLKEEGWQAIKYRCSFPTLKDDVALIEETRKLVGDEWVIMADGNKAGMTYTSGRGVPWDFARAADTALAYQELGVYFLEEPLPRYEFDAIAELNRLVHMQIVGGEGNHTLHEFQWLLERGCYDTIQPEIMAEGPTAMLTMATLAKSMGKYCIPHVGDMRLGTICNLHLVASWSNSPYIEVFNEIPVGAYTYPFSVFENPPTLDREGYLPVPQGPGLGVTIRPELLADD